MSTTLRIVGLMSGTSADGIDAALVSVSGSGKDTSFSIERFITVPFSSDIRESLLDASRNYTGTYDMALWHFRLGQLLAEAVSEVLAGAEADLVASHGHTVAHVSQAEHRATLQLGCPAVIAERTGLTVVADFRSSDIAAGGQGAPLVSFVDAVCLQHPNKSRSLLNIGGIANITFVPASSSADQPSAFDTGPGNVLLDLATCRVSGETEHVDVNGERAARGKVLDDVLAWLLEHPYLAKKPPKSTGREEFGDHLTDQAVERVRRAGGSSDDVLATLTAFTVQTIVRGVRSLPDADEIVVAGGGTHNKTMMRLLREALAPTSVTTSDVVGIPPDAKEALAFAILANQTIRGLPGNVPGCTGAAYETILGSITPGKNFPDLIRRLYG